MEPMVIDGTGVWSAGLRYGDRAEARDAASELEELGYTALWVPDVGGDLFAVLDDLLDATRRSVVATGILNLWLHEPPEVAARFHAAVAAHGPRLLVGIGVSHAPLVDAVTSETYERPLTRMRGYLDDLDALPEPLPVEARVLAALGPKMTALAAERSRGVHPYLCTPELTARSRAAVGPDRIVAPEQAVVLDEDVDRARGIARQHLAGYLGLPNYAGSLRRLGFTDEDLAEGGSDGLVDAIVVHGDEAAIAARVDEHRAAGADHVCIQVLTGRTVDLPLDEWRRLAPALTT